MKAKLILALLPLALCGCAELGVGADVEKYALIVPAFDEAPVAKDVVRELRQAWADYGLEGDIVVVDDGSTDGTPTSSSARRRTGPGCACCVTA